MVVEGSRLGCSGPTCTSQIADWPEADGAVGGWWGGGGCFTEGMAMGMRGYR